MKKISYLILLSILLFSNSCGRKGPLEYEGERPKPKFDKVIDE